MVCEIIRDVILLSRISQKANVTDRSIGENLLDTLTANAEGCAGLAANMIGESKRIIAFFDGDKPVLMYNPEILSKAGAYQTEESCLSLDGVRSVRRYKMIRVRFLNEAFRVRICHYAGFTAQVIQHEIDHCDGILI